MCIRVYCLFYCFISAYVFNNDIRIREFYNMTDITKTDLELFQKYDCHCEVPNALTLKTSSYIYEFMKLKLEKKNQRNK